MSCDFSGLRSCGAPGPGTGQPYDYDVMAPFVKITVAKGGSAITVGNQSCPNYENGAIITEMSYSLAEGAMGEIKISDQHGGPFFNFWDTLLKCAEQKDLSTVIVDNFVNNKRT